MPVNARNRSVAKATTAATAVGVTALETVQKTLPLQWGNISVPKATTTSYLGAGFSSSAASANPSPNVCQLAGTLSKLYVRLGSNSDRDTTYTVYKNGVATTLTCTISAGAGNVTGSDLTHSVSVAAGDQITLQSVEVAGAAADQTTVAACVTYVIS